MMFNQWHDDLCCRSCAQNCPHKEWERVAWNAAKADAAKDTDEYVASLQVENGNLREALLEVKGDEFVSKLLNLPEQECSICRRSMPSTEYSKHRHVCE